MAGSLKVKSACTSRLCLWTEAACTPHPCKVDQGGEDAYFVSTVGGGAFGVADGVGGWRSRGVNPADYSQTFMHNVKMFLEGREHLLVEGPYQDPVMECDGALTQLKAVAGRNPLGGMMIAHAVTRVAGSSTACIVQLDEATGQLEAANLGDSGFLILREGTVLAQSRSLQHSFDCPLQFGHPGLVQCTDWAADADTYTVQVQPGDIIIAGSDGLWDNVFAEEIMHIVGECRADIEEAACRILELATCHASDHKFQSPYYLKAQEEWNRVPWWERFVGACLGTHMHQPDRVLGGKPDDITVLVSMVCERCPPDHPSPPLMKSSSATIKANPSPLYPSPRNDTLTARSDSMPSRLQSARSDGVGCNIPATPRSCTRPELPELDSGDSSLSSPTLPSNTVTNGVHADCTTSSALVMHSHSDYTSSSSLVMHSHADYTSSSALVVHSSEEPGGGDSDPAAEALSKGNEPCCKGNDLLDAGHVAGCNTGAAWNASISASQKNTSGDETLLINLEDCLSEPSQPGFHLGWNDPGETPSPRSELGQNDSGEMMSQPGSGLKQNDSEEIMSQPGFQLGWNDSGEAPSPPGSELGQDFGESRYGGRKTSSDAEGVSNRLQTERARVWDSVDERDGTSDDGGKDRNITSSSCSSGSGSGGSGMEERSCVVEGVTAAEQLPTRGSGGKVVDEKDMTAAAQHPNSSSCGGSSSSSRMEAAAQLQVPGLRQYSGSTGKHVMSVDVQQQVPPLRRYSGSTDKHVIPPGGQQHVPALRRYSESAERHVIPPCAPVQRMLSMELLAGTGLVAWLDAADSATRGTGNLQVDNGAAVQVQKQYVQSGMVVGGTSHSSGTYDMPAGKAATCLVQQQYKQIGASTGSASQFSANPTGSTSQLSVHPSGSTSQLPQYPTGSTSHLSQNPTGTTSQLSVKPPVVGAPLSHQARAEAQQQHVKQSGNTSLQAGSYGEAADIQDALCDVLSIRSRSGSRGNVPAITLTHQQHHSQHLSLSPQINTDQAGLQDRLAHCEPAVDACQTCEEVGNKTSTPSETSTGMAQLGRCSAEKQPVKVPITASTLNAHIKSHNISSHKPRAVKVGGKWIEPRHRYSQSGFVLEACYPYRKHAVCDMQGIRVPVIDWSQKGVKSQGEGAARVDGEVVDLLGL